MALLSRVVRTWLPLFTARVPQTVGSEGYKAAT